MPTFLYTAKTNQGRTVKGELSADNETAALRALDERALFPLAVREGKAADTRSMLGGARHIKARYVSMFYSQLADLLRAGVPLLRSLDVLSRSNERSGLGPVVKALAEDVAAGEPLADAMRKHPNAFKDLHVSMVAAGERGGFLEDVLSRVAIFLERQDELRNKLLGSLIYPMVLLSGGVGVVCFMMGFIVPKIRKVLERGGDLPILTRALFTISDFFKDHWAMIIFIVGGAIAAAVIYAKTATGRRNMDLVLLRAPALGNVLTMVAVCRFCRILGTLLGNGVPILQSLRIAKDSAGNAILAEAIDEAADSVRDGETLAVPLGESGLFPPDIIDMVAVAEESNNLESVLVQIADTNETRTARQIDLVVRLIEPILLIVIAVIVLFIALALLVPILSGSAKGMH